MRSVIRLLALLAAAFCCPVSHAVITVVDGTGCFLGFGGSLNCSVGAVTSGQMVIIGVVAATNAANATVAGSIGTTYTLIGTTDNIANNRHAAVWYTISTGGTETVTVTCPSCSTSMSILPAVVAGQAISGFIHQTDLTFSSTSTPACTSTYSRSGNEMIFQLSLAEGTGSLTWGSSASSPGPVTLGAHTDNANAYETGALYHQYITSGTTYTIASDAGITTRMVCNGFSVYEAGSVPSASPRHRKKTIL